MATGLFTPNTDNSGALRYRLYRHDGELFSITPKGEKFGGTVSRAPCGLGCYCGAYLTPYSERGAQLLAKAKRIDSLSRIVKAA